MIPKEKVITLLGWLSYEFNLEEEFYEETTESLLASDSFEEMLDSQK